MFRNVLLTGLGSCLTGAASLSLQAQQNETAWFKDVTATHVPIDGREHACIRPERVGVGKSNGPCILPSIPSGQV